MSQQRVANTTEAPVVDAPSIAVEGVSVFYGEVVGLSAVGMTLGPGITGIVGPNGSGKTTLMRVLTGLMVPQDGRVEVLGGNPFTDAQVRARIGFVPATAIFFGHATGQRNLELAFLARGESGRRARDLARQALETVGLTKDGHRRYNTWSRGMRQRLKLGYTLTADVDIVLLDEPFLGVDPPSRHRIRELVAQLGEQARTVLVSSHVLHEVEALTRQVSILAHGRLLGSGSIGTLLAEMRERYPQRFVVEADKPRALAAELMGLTSVRGVRVQEDGSLEMMTSSPDEACEALAGAVVRSGSVIRGLRSDSQSLEALFSQVTAAGASRL